MVLYHYHITLFYSRNVLWPMVDYAFTNMTKNCTHVSFCVRKNAVRVFLVLNAEIGRNHTFPDSAMNELWIYYTIVWKCFYHGWGWKGSRATFRAYHKKTVQLFCYPGRVNSEACPTWYLTWQIIPLILLRIAMYLNWNDFNMRHGSFDSKVHKPSTIYVLSLKICYSNNFLPSWKGLRTDFLWQYTKQFWLETRSNHFSS